jgi:hypothetical protein
MVHSARNWKLSNQGRSNVRFLDLGPTEDVPELLTTADIHLLPHRSEAADLVCLPSLRLCWRQAG